MKSINNHPPQQRDSLNINDALHDLSTDINRNNSVKNKKQNFLFEKNCSIEINSDITTREPVDKFIDDLVEGIETFLPQPNLNLNIGFALKQEYEYRQLPSIELRRFGGNPSQWPESHF